MTDAAVHNNGFSIVAQALAKLGIKHMYGVVGIPVTELASAAQVQIPLVLQPYMHFTVEYNIVFHLSTLFAPDKPKQRALDQPAIQPHGFCAISQPSCCLLCYLMY